MSDGAVGAPRLNLSAITPVGVVEGGSLDCGSGLLLLVRSQLNRAAPGDVIEVRSRESSVRNDLPVWCRLTQSDLIAIVDSGDHTKYFIRKPPSSSMPELPDWGIRLPRRADGSIDFRAWLKGRIAEIPEQASTYFGFAPRGAVVEPGTPAFPYTLNHKVDVWADNLADLYEQAKAQQWNASNDIAWRDLPQLPDDLERAVCQLMTFLAENEYAALYMPAKFLPRINAQFTEVVLFLSTVINDEARHIEAFTKRALANGGGLQYATALTEWSLQSLLVNEDYFRSSFLLHVLGEGTFLDLLDFIERYAPDPVTADVVRRARNDEGRHVAYGIAHVRQHLQRQPTAVEELVSAAEARAEVLQATTGANPIVMESLAILAGGGIQPEQMARGLARVRELQQEMHEHRVRRMLQIGLEQSVAEKISHLHTPNFM